MSAQIPPGYDLSQIPAGRPPPGVQSNLVDPPTLGPAIIAVSVTMMALACIFVTGRIITNARRLGWSDCCCVLALVLSLGYTASVLATTREARHQWDLPLSFITPAYLKLLFVQGMLLGPCIFFAKISIFLLYFQLFTVNKINRQLIYAGMLFTFLLYWTNVALEPYFCAPHAGQSWEISVGKRCARLTTWGVVQGIMVVVLDLYIFILPIPIILNLRLPKKQKLSVLIVFMTAALGVVAGVAAAVLRFLLRFRPQDPGWYAAALSITIIVEDFIAIIVSCMPAFAALTKRMATEMAPFSSLWSSLLKSSQQSLIRERKSGSHAKIHLPPSTEQLFQPYTGDDGYKELHEVRVSGSKSSTRTATPV